MVCEFLGFYVSSWHSYKVSRRTFSSETVDCKWFLKFFLSLSVKPVVYCSNCMLKGVCIVNRSS
jgi:hypothetical protein